MVDKINISESDIRRMVTESVKRILGEANEFARGIPAHIRDKFIKKVAAEHPELDPNGFYYTSTGDLLHNGKKRPKAAPKEPKPIVPKPEGMSDETYLTEFVPKYNKKFANGLLAARELFGEDEMLEPLDVSDFKNMSEDFANSFADRYYISQYGILYTSNSSNTSNCHLSIPYFAPQTKRFQVNLRIYDENGKELWHTCPSVVKLVRKVYGDEWANRLIEIERQMLLNKQATMNNSNVDF